MSASKYDESNPDRHLRQAAFENDAQEISRLLKYKKPDVNAQGPDTGRTALHQAAIKNHLDSVLLLLHKGANSDLKDNAGKSAADLASSPEIKMVLSIAPIAFEAIDFAKRILPSDSKLRFFGSREQRMTEELKIQEYNQALDTKQTTFCERFFQSEIIDRLRDTTQLNNTFFLYNIVTILQAMLETGYKRGTCGDRFIAASAYILCKNPELSIQKLLIEPKSAMEKIITDGTRYDNHALLMINHNGTKFTPGAGDFLYCDPFQDGDVSTNKHPQKFLQESIASGLKVGVPNHSSYIPEKDDTIHPEISQITTSLRTELEITLKKYDELLKSEKQEPVRQL